MALTFSPPAAPEPSHPTAARGPILSAPAIDLAKRWAGRLLPLLQAIVILSIWFLTRFYRGIVHDSRIYVGRALADLDPQGLGREPAFLYDEQTRHTIFSHLIRPMVAALGPSATSIAVTLAGLLIWLAAAAVLARALMPRRLVPAALVCAAVLPAVYGPFDIFSFGEALATPRGFAEAGVMAGLAALLGGRRLLCGALLALAALFQPIMAAPGFGVMFLVLAQEDRRWWRLAPLGAIGLAAAGALHLGPAKTLFSAYDPDWLRVMHLRNGFLFLADWPPAAWYAAAPATATLALAALRFRGRHRTLIVAAIVVTAAGLAASFTFADGLHSLLIVQLQLWRALWLLQVLAVLLVPAVALELWAMERRDARLAMVLMGLAWLTFSGTVWSLPTLALALICATTAAKGGADKVSARVLIATSVAAVALLLATTAAGVWVAVKMVQTFAALPSPLPFNFLLALKLHAAPIIALALAPLLIPARIKPAVRAMVVVLCAALLPPLTASVWDQRTPTRRMVDLGQGRADLNRLIGPETGSGVVWIPDETAPWFLLSRATWVSDLEGSIGAFSRPLAMGWDARSAALFASGFNTIRNRNPWVQTSVPRTLDAQQSRDSALRLCAVKAGPQAVVLQGDLANRFPHGAATLWRAPVTDVMQAPGSSTLKLMVSNAYTVVRCDHISARAAEGNLTSKP